MLYSQVKEKLPQEGKEDFTDRDKKKLSWSETE